MKKLMMAVAIVCVAAGARAASVQWGGAFGNDTDGGTLASGSVAYLIYSPTAQITAITDLMGTAIDSVAKNGNTEVGTVKQIYNLTPADLNPENQSFFATRPGNISELNGYYAVVLVDAADGKVGDFRDLGNVSLASETSNPADLRINPDWDNEDNYLGNNGYTVAVAPEPTSGLLLLLGVAGLALRRRRA